ncbi:prefoldin subunit 6 [Lentinula edodes]|uniref:Prefoldin subunit 6 n=1 Tax=Lentinula edodes TaxID=5353 RepID=A0A1Q3EFU3_LENED|nr:prefoldin subunit 6 [Lentinula edodes]
MMSSLQSLREKLQAASVDFQKVQVDLSNVVEARQRLDAQLSENELVKKEFAVLTPENIIYKQIGPVLVKQDQADAKSTVDTRLDFIRGEIDATERYRSKIGTEKIGDCRNSNSNPTAEPAFCIKYCPIPR